MLMEESLKAKSIKTIAVTSGKGGVGKTNITANLAMEIRKKGFNVMILDADLGLSNIDILFQIAPKYNLQHVLNGQMSLQDIIVEGPMGIKILPASSGVQELTALNEFQRLKLLESFDSYNFDVDYFLIDTAAGISENVAFFCVAAQEIVIVATPEPTSLTDAYALIKVLFTRYQEKEFRVLVNFVKNPEEALSVFTNLSKVAERFLSISLDYIGYIPFDDAVKKAVKAQRPVVDIFPESISAKQFSLIADRFLNKKNAVKGSLQFFIGNLLSARNISLQKA